MDKGFQIQDWDTEYFGFKVAKLEDNSLSNYHTIKSVFSNLERNDVFFAYYYSNKPLDSSLFNNQYYFFEHVVTRIPLVMRLDRSFQFHKNIKFYKEGHVDKSLNELAILAGLNGRFGRDKRISQKEEIFKSWIKKSILNNEFILTYEIDNKIVGMVTFRIEGEDGYGGLMAIYPEFEGKNISFALLSAMMHVLYEKGCDFFYSGTQQLNKKALRVFERFGLIRLPEVYVYHLWRKPN